MAKPLAKYIDHTLLKPDAIQDQIDEVLAQAKQYGFASVCIIPIGLFGRRLVCATRM